VNETETVIAGALRDIADQAAAPPRMADAAWRAGRRRRLLGATATSAAATAGIITIGAVVVAAVFTTGAPGSPGHGGGFSAAGQPTARGHLRTPIQLEQVASIGGKPCAAGADEMPQTAPVACVHLTGTGMTITSVESARVQRATAGWAVDIRLTRADSRLFGAMTSEMVGLRSPHNQVAIIIGGHVLARPAVEAPITAGQVQLEFPARAQAESIVRGLSR
jgi:hypothetical protein